jgi:hypothetical protein
MLNSFNGLRRCAGLRVVANVGIMTNRKKLAQQGRVSQEFTD